MPTLPLPPPLVRRFLQLSSALSPENLAADGERSPAEVCDRRQRLEREWRNLEREAGRSVTEEEVWRAADLQGSHQTR